MGQRLLAFVLVLFCASAFAERRSIVYQTNGQWVVEVFEVPLDDFQERVGRYAFPTFAEAQNFVADRGVRLFQSTPRDLVEPRFMTMLPDEAIWEVENEWNWEWERRYARWIEREVTENFFVRYGIATDCADAAIALRWIFARIHKLPMGNSLAVSGRLFTQASMKQVWAHLPTAEEWHQDRRFRAALVYILDNAYTHSLNRDSYPVEIQRETFLPGVHHLTLYGESGHTTFVKKVDPYTGKLTMYYSTVPQMVRELGSWSFYEVYPSTERNGGFKRMRWVERHGDSWRMVPAIQMPTYSTEQYENSFMSGRLFYEAIELRLGLGSNPQDIFRDLLDEVKKNFKEREQIVSEGRIACLREDCAPGTPGWENWSTPSRDGRIVQRLQTLMTMRESFVHDREINGLWQDAMDNFSVWAGAFEIKFSDLVDIFLNERHSTDPRDSERRRWGIE